jgi:hypothetical protein
MQEKKRKKKDFCFILYQSNIKEKERAEEYVKHPIGKKA